MKAKTKRVQIVEAADELFYRQGYHHTSFANIAAAVNMSRGNFYHHFKAKDQILAEVIEARLAKTQGMLMLWQQQGEGPADRIQRFMNILRANRESIQASGCPVGSLSTELAKLQHGARGDAQKIFNAFRDWLALQFEQLGHVHDAPDLAMHLLGRVQGIAVVMNAYQDDKFVETELQALYRWLDRISADAAVQH